MTRYSVQPWGPIFVKVYGLLFFAKIMGKNIGKNISKNVSGKYSQKPIDHANQFVTDAFKTTSKRAMQKTTEETGDLIGKEIVDKITKVSKTSPQNNSKTVTNEKNIRLDRKTSSKTYISAEKRQKITDDLRLIQQYNNGVSRNKKLVR